MKNWKKENAENEKMEKWKKNYEKMKKQNELKIEKKLNWIKIKKLRNYTRIYLCPSSACPCCPTTNKQDYSKWGNR